jgi:TRAP-type C4-dicarboxylate transport system permease small subunit
MVKRAIELIVSSFLLVIVVTNVLQVFLRYVFGYSIVFSEELSRYSMIWMAFIAAGLLALENGHAKIGIIEKYKINKFVFPITQLLSISVATIVFIAGLKISIQSWNQPIPTLPFSAGVAYLALPIGMSILVIGLIKSIRRFRGDKTK